MLLFCASASPRTDRGNTHEVGHAIKELSWVHLCCPLTNRFIELGNLFFCHCYKNQQKRHKPQRGCCQKWAITREEEHLWEQAAETAVAADFSSDMPCCSELSGLDCTTSSWSATNGAFPLSCEGCRNMCQMWCLVICQTDKAMFETLPSFLEYPLSA